MQPEPPEKTVHSVQKSTKEPWVELAQDEHKLWHWCMWSKNAKPMAMNTAGFVRQNDAWMSWMAAREAFATYGIKKVVTANHASRRGRRKARPAGETSPQPEQPPMVNPIHQPEPEPEPTEDIP